MSVLPLILIPQLLLCGFMKPLDDVYRGTQTGRPATIQEYERFQGVQPDPRAEPIARIEGLGAGSYVSALMGARWSLDALTHVVGRTDPDSRARLASQLTVAAYGRVRAGDDEDAIRSAYTSRVLVCWLALAFSAAVFVAGAAMMLRSKDSL